MVDFGQKNSKFFFHLEKKHQACNSIGSLKTDNGVVNNVTDILEEEVRYYTNLYQSKSIKNEDIDKYLQDVSLEHSLNDTQKSLCEGLLSLDECTSVINQMKKNKSPGSDGLPLEFYCKVWSSINSLVLNALNQSFFTGKMSPSQKKTIITLIFKKGDRELLKNWRPVSLLNTDNKIAAFAMSN